MAGLHFLKHTYSLSDERTVEEWVENPYWQYFCGMKYFEHIPPITPSLMSIWRKRIGPDLMEKMLKETIVAGFQTRTITEKSLLNVNADTTVQEKAIAFPTDARLYFRMIEKLVKHAKKIGLSFRQSYLRVAQMALVQSGRYFHARQSIRGHREVKRLKTFLGRLTRDLTRKMAATRRIDDLMKHLLELSERLQSQEKDSKNKVYSLHAVEVECISKGKAHKKYEFGNKAAFLTTSLEGFVLGGLGLHGNPYDGHTLKNILEQAKGLCQEYGNIKRVFVDRSYKGHGYQGSEEVYVCGPGMGRGLASSLRRWFKRRSAIEPIIGHMKSDGRLGRNYLMGKVGDQINVLLSAVGQNLRFILGKIKTVGLLLPSKRLNVFSGSSG
jgi:IS5 family transposase